MNRYRYIPTTKDPFPRKGTTVYPNLPAHPDDIYLISTIGDRFDVLASEYYGDSSLWWIIASANPEIARDTLSITPGIQIRVPHDKVRILNLYAQANINR